MEHYHVVCFVNGCLNDYDSGPLESLDDARVALAEYANSDTDEFRYWVPAGVDRYQQHDGLYTLVIEPCCDNECQEPW
jgi:hypothetical protein